MPGVNYVLQIPPTSKIPRNQKEALGWRGKRGKKRETFLKGLKLQMCSQKDYFCRYYIVKNTLHLFAISDLLEHDQDILRCSRTVLLSLWMRVTSPDTSVIWGGSYFRLCAHFLKQTLFWWTVVYDWSFKSIFCHRWLSLALTCGSILGCIHSKKLFCQLHVTFGALINVFLCFSV